MIRPGRPLIAVCLAVVILAAVFPGAMVFMAALVVPVWTCSFEVLSAG